MNPTALVEPINAAEAQGAAAKAELKNLPEPSQVTAAEIYPRIDMIGELGISLSSAQPERLNKLYDTIGLELRYAPDEQRVTIPTPRAGLINKPVGEGSCFVSAGSRNLAMPRRRTAPQ